MNIIVCIDDNYGYSLFGKRQSKDKLLCERILSLVGEECLYMNEYSSKQFEDGLLAVCEEFLSVAAEGEYCFVENVPFSFDNCEKLVIYKWNRSYPSDLKLDYDFVRKNYTLISCDDFVGNSHQRITEEIYVKA